MLVFNGKMRFNEIEKINFIQVVDFNPYRNAREHCGVCRARSDFALVQFDLAVHSPLFRH